MQTVPAPLWAQGRTPHIPRWLCLRNAVGAPLRRLPPFFFINRINLSSLEKRRLQVPRRSSEVYATTIKERGNKKKN